MDFRNVLRRERLQRLRLGKTLFDLSVASGIPMTRLSMSERGLQRLTPEQERRRREALDRLAGVAQEAAAR